MALQPTQQQEDIRDAAATGEGVVVKALAGSGKTSTLKMIASDRPGVRMTYVAFNRAIADDAKTKFPRNTVVKTAHGFAYAFVSQHEPDLMERLRSQARVPAWKVVDILRIPGNFAFGKVRLRDRKLAGLVKETVARFCRTTEVEPQPWMVPTVPGLDSPEAKEALATFLLPYVDRAWGDLTRPNGHLQFTHDVYLRMAALHPDFSLPGEVILADEFQDADPIIQHMVRRQQVERGAQIITVGDDFQSIYAWRGARNALGAFEAKYQLALTKSWRFGPAVATEANLLLTMLQSDLVVEGNEAVDSRLVHLTNPDIVLCRTNAEAVAQLLEAQVEGLQAGMVGGTTQVEALARAALDLTEGRQTFHPELQAFMNWEQVREYCESEQEARDLQVLVRLVDRHGAETLLEAVEKAVPEANAQLRVSTAHKIKGLEFDAVQLASDFPPPVLSDRKGFDDGELKLAYVAVTRARKFLDSSALTYLHYLAEKLGQEREFLPADQVPVREQVAVASFERAQVMCDPETEHRLIITDTKYDPAMVEAQRTLPGSMYQSEYAGFQKVRIVNASYKVGQFVEQFGLTITAAAKQRIADFS